MGNMLVNERVISAFDVRKLQSQIDIDMPRRYGVVLYRRVAKRIFDVLFVLVAAVPAVMILLPLMAIIALDGRSPIYIQRRIGLNGKVFRMFKLRSMIAGADEVLEHYLSKNPEARREWDVTQKLKSDPRITPFGHFIRKSSLDELPQLFNVLNGTMSIVGPRPMMVNQRDLYPGAAYYAMRPGITGYWQISERNDCSFSDRSTYDTKYYREMSLGTDISVLASTVKVVLRGTGY